MGKKVFYKYNPETDNFERYYPSWKNRLLQVTKIIILSCILTGVTILIYSYYFVTPTEENLRVENKKLKSSYSVLSRRLENMHNVVGKIAERDDNFYRVMLQMDPMSPAQRFSGLTNEKRYKELSKLSDEKLVDELNDRMNLLEGMISAQIQSFEQLGVTLKNQQDKLSHIPAILPINIKDYTMSSGFGWRNDPIMDTSKFHAGLDFASSMGTEVYATGDGKVVFSGHKTGYGNCIDIDHGYNYTTRYAHLSEILVNNGEQLKRGQLIGKVGSTGKSTGPHLHYEVRYKDEPQNPVNYYFLDVTPEEYYEMIQRAENAGHVMD